MNYQESKSPERQRIDREAADWIAKKARGFTAEEQDAFFEWLALDPRHSEYYGIHWNMWKRLDRLAEWKPEHSHKPNQNLLAYQRRSSRLRFWISGLAAGFAVIFSLWLLGNGFFDTDAPQMARRMIANEYESHSLEDGSVIELNLGAEVEVNYTKKERRINLVSSEAHFNVAKDVDRPFVVSVRDIEIRAVGTAFNIRLLDDSVEVLVTEGRVEIKNSNESESGDSAIRELGAGQLSVVSPEAEDSWLEVEEATYSQIDRILTWKPMLLEFDSTPLSEVIDAFNERNQTKIVIAETELESLPIMASFRSANVEHFVELLELTLPIRVEREKPNEIAIYKQ